MDVESGDLQLVHCPGPERRDAALLDMVASGRGSLNRVLGDAQRRIRLFSTGIDWSRVIVAYRDGNPVGYALMRYGGHSAYRPSWRAFRETYGARGALLPYCVFHFAERWGSRKAFYLYRIFVMPEHRRQGIAAALLDAVVAYAARSGYAEMELDVGSNFVPAYELYRSRGFEAAHELDIGFLRKLMPLGRVIRMRYRIPQV